MTHPALATVLAAVLENKGITPEQLVGSADLAHLLAKAEQSPQATKEATMSQPNFIVVKGIVVPAPVKGAAITADVKKLYNSALSRTGNGTLGVGGATYDNLVVKYALLAGYSDSPAERKQTVPAATATDANPALAKLLQLLAVTQPETPKQTTAEPGTLRHAIATYQPVEKNRVWIKANGKRVACSEKQYQTWSARREATKQDTPVTVPVVEPAIPTSIDINALAQNLLALITPVNG